MAEQPIKWQSVKLQWPENSTAWLGDFAKLNGQINDQQNELLTKIDDLAALVSYQPDQLAEDAQQAVNTASHALTEQFAISPYCLTVTPFQLGIGTGKGYFKYLAAPNLINHLLTKLNDGGDAQRPAGDNLDAIIILFLSHNYRQFSDLITLFSSMLNIEELEIAGRRADYLANLELSRQIIPKAPTLPHWQTLNMEKLNLVGQIKNSLTSQVAELQSYTTSSPIDTLKDLLATKQKQQQEQQQAIEDLKQQLANNQSQGQMQAVYLTGGTTSDIRQAILELDNPAYDWPLCAGCLFIGPANGLAFVREVLGIAPHDTELKVL